MKINTISTQTWVWRSMIKTGIIPLIMVETVLIAVYLLSNHFISTDNMKYIKSQVNDELEISSKREMEIIGEKLKNIVSLTSLYRNETVRALTATGDEIASEKSNLKMSNSGVLFSLNDRGGAASFYSAFTSKKDLTKVYKLAMLDPLMKQIKQNNELVASIYFNSWDSYNRIYPWFSTMEQYPTDMKIPDYNFYYLATDKYNPERGVVWTDVYIDPAGHGWMASAIAPVYNQDFLEGVVGLDIKVSTIVESIQHLSIPWDGYALLASDNGTIMALPPEGEQDFGVKELTDHHYQQAISKEVFKPEQFNLNKHSETVGLSKQLNESAQGIMQITLNGMNKLVSWVTIPETHWQLLMIVDENKMYAASRSLEKKYRNIGYILIFGLVIFYSIFLLFIWFSSKKMSRAIATPLTQIQNMVQKVSMGDFYVSHSGFRLKELDETADSIIQMGTKLDMLTSALKDAKLQAEDANVAKSLFLSTVSHEIRSPMNSILGMTHVLLHSKVNAEQHNNLVTIDKSCNHLLSLINDILDLSKLSAGKFELEYIPFDITAIVYDVRDIFEYNAKKNQVIIHTDVENNLPMLLGDPLRIKRVLLNFVSNAIKFTNKGEVTIRVCSEYRTGKSIGLRMSVQDTGIGLSVEDQLRMFDDFQQVDSSTTRKYGGTGLGLAICKRIAHLMGGKVGVESQRGVGSTFWLIMELSIEHSLLDVARNQLDEALISREMLTEVPSLECENMDLSVLLLKLQHFSKLLEDSDLEAEFYYSQHKSCFERVCPDLALELEKYVVSYDFDNALKSVEGIRSFLSECLENICHNDTH